MATTARRAFSGMPVNYETAQPAAEGTVSDYHMDTRRANSKYYNPQSFDPATLDY